MAMQYIILIVLHCFVLHNIDVVIIKYLSFLHRFVTNLLRRHELHLYILPLSRQQEAVCGDHLKSLHFWFRSFYLATKMHWQMSVSLENF